MADDQTGVSAAPIGRLIALIVAGIILGNVVLSLVTDRDTGLGVDELIAFGGGALLGLVVEFGIVRRLTR